MEIRVDINLWARIIISDVVAKFTDCNPKAIIPLAWHMLRLGRLSQPRPLKSLQDAKLHDTKST